MGRFDKDFATEYKIRKPGNGAYVFVINGNVTVAGNVLSTRDGLGIWNTDKITLTADSQDAEVLIMDVPMTLS